MGHLEIIEKLKHYVDKMYKPKDDGIAIRYFYYRKYQKLYSQLKNQIEVAQQVNKYIFEQYKTNEELVFETIMSKFTNKECIAHARYFTEANRNKLEDRLLKEGTLEEVCLYAKTGLGNQKRLEEFIISSNNPYWIYQFGVNVEDADIELVTNTLINIGNVKYVYLLSNYFKDTNKINLEKAENFIMNSDDLMWMGKYALNVKKMSLDEFIYYIGIHYTAQQVMDYTMRKRNLSGSHIKDLENDYITSKNAEGLYELALKDEKANIAVIEDAIITTNNLKYMLLFAKHVQWANIPLIEEAIIKSGDLKSIAEFVVNVGGSKIEECIDKILRSEDPEAIFILANSESSEFLEKCEKRLIELKAEEYLLRLYSKSIKTFLNKNRNK